VTATSVPRSSPVLIDPDILSRLSTCERAALTAWAEAGSSHVTAVHDLTSRGWADRPVSAVLGMFRADDAAASWLLVRHNGAWALACVADGQVSTPHRTLAAALTSLR
jgi:hypothetical protein